jgi:hypothetical protein
MINLSRKREHGGCGRVMAMETRTLESVLDEAHAPDYIDYMSLDTEGSELDILSTFPFHVSVLSVKDLPVLTQASRVFPRGAPALYDRRPDHRACTRRGEAAGSVRSPDGAWLCMGPGNTPQ